MNKMKKNLVVDGWAEVVCDNCRDLLRIDIDQVGQDEEEEYCVVCECCGLMWIIDFMREENGEISYTYYSE
jgi:RNase P subunit RPR2